MSSTLPRAVNDASVVTPVSTTRLIQLNTALETAAAYLAPPGVAATGGGALVTKTTGFAVSVSAAVFLYEFYAHTLAAPQAYSSATNTNTTIRLWGKITRTAAAQTSSDPRTNSDTYALTLTHTNGASYATAPASGPWIPLADWLTDGTGISGPIDNGPPGKYSHLASPLWRGENVIDSGETVAVASGEGLQVIPSLQVRGLMIVRGAVRVRGYG